nr:unnamed protein product [Digitaria exilis]
MGGRVELWTWWWPWAEVGAAYLGWGSGLAVGVGDSTAEHGRHGRSGAAAFGTLGRRFGRSRTWDWENVTAIDRSFLLPCRSDLRSDTTMLRGIDSTKPSLIMHDHD